MKNQKTKELTLQVKCHAPFDDYESHPFCQTFHLPHQNVRDVLSDEVDEWDSSCPVFIDAPTGLGKTTFIYEEILPRAAEQHKNVLILSNRTALSNQQKIHVMKKTCSPLEEMLTEKGVQAQDVFGSVGVITYHRLPKFLSIDENRKWCENLGYIICDEAHFFTSDSLFNCDVDRILKLVTSKFCTAIRIYLTATPWDVIHPICKAEQENYLDYSRTFLNAGNRFYTEPRHMIYYRFARNYDHLDLHFFQDFSEILPSINSADAEKWLIFVDNKEKAAKLRSEISVPLTYLDSESKGIREWNELIKNERFESKVLLSTAVIDCGVNINDPTLTNVVILSDSRVSMMQMAGRRRCQYGERVNIWVQDLSKQKLINRYQRYFTYLRLEDEYDNVMTDKDRQHFVNRIWHFEDATVRNLFTVMLHKVYKNGCAFVFITRMIRFYEKLLYGNTSFREEVEQWFEKESPNTDNEIDVFYKNHRDSILSEQDKDELRQIIARAYKRAGFTEAQPRRVTSLQHTALNNRLQELALPYEVQPINGGWKLVFLGLTECGEG